jgi:outer membrane protein assembly factor BamB
MYKQLLFVLALGLAPAGILWAEDLSKAKDWPQWRGPRRDAISTETGLLREWPKDGPRLLWNSKTVSGGKSIGTGYSSISIADGKIYTMGDHGSDGFVFCLEEETGKQLWATRVSPGQGDGPRCTPTVDGDRVYALSRQGNLVCLDTAKGDILWQKDFKKDFKGRMMSGWDYSESPTIDGDRLICTPGGDEAALIALNKMNGEVIWKAPISNTGGAGYASIVTAEVGGIKQYITLLGASRGLVAVDAKDGKFLWSYKKIANGTANIPTAIVKGDLVFASTGYGSGAALLQLVPTDEGIKAEEIYFLPGKTLQNHHGGMVLLGDYIFGGHGHNQGSPFCVDMKSGKFAWGPERGPGDGSAAVVYADGHFYFRYQNNVLALIEATPEGYHLKSQFNLPSNLGTGWQHPVVLHGRLYIRGRDQLLCYDVRQK